MMRVLNHGGHCCGIKHILGFPYSPSEAVAGLPLKLVNHGASAEMTHPAQDFYPGPEPMETGKVRLEKLLHYIDEKKKARKQLEASSRRTWLQIS